MPAVLATLRNAACTSPRSMSWMTPEAPFLFGSAGQVEIAGALGEIGHVVMRIGADADGAVAHLAGVLLGVIDQLGARS